MRTLLLLTCLVCTTAVSLHAQNRGYLDSLKKFREDYVQKHLLVPKDKKQYFRFFPIKSQWAITCRFERLTDTVGMVIKNTDKSEIKYFRYGKLYFTINQQPQELTVLQSPLLLKQPEWADYLLVSFTDGTTGKQSYGSGRYIDLRIGDIQNNTLLLDFNKAYNPYCAYMPGFSCPIPPKENRLSATIEAGEKTWKIPFQQ